MLTAFDVGSDTSAALWRWFVLPRVDWDNHVQARMALEDRRVPPDLYGDIEAFCMAFEHGQHQHEYDRLMTLWTRRYREFVALGDWESCDEVTP